MRRLVSPLFMTLLMTLAHGQALASDVIATAQQAKVASAWFESNMTERIDVEAKW